MIRLTISLEARVAAASSLAAIKSLAWEYPGDHELEVVIPAANPRPGELGTRDTRRLRLGPLWTYDASPEVVSALEEYGVVEVEDFPQDAGPPA